MTTLLQQFRRIFGRRATPAPAPAEPARPQPAEAGVRPLEIEANDPLLAYIQGAPGVIDLETLRLESPMVERLRASGARLAVPLISQGELVGIISLGPRRSEQDYSSDDKALLGNLAAQATPALRVAQLVRHQQIEARERERLAQELKVARLIQQTLLPRAVPTLPGWQITPYYEPAREVGGDFYDFIELPEGKLGLLIADVTDKGVPAALVMATTRSILRGTALRLDSPGAVLERVNELLCPDIPHNMFVTCFYAILDPATGLLRFANAGHDLPYWHRADGVHELRARGMPLGLMPGMQYEEKEVTLAPGEHLLLYSDGLVEAHNSAREMFSFERLAGLVADAPKWGKPLVDTLLEELARFTGPGWVQEDDITLVSIGREPAMDEGPKAGDESAAVTPPPAPEPAPDRPAPVTPDWTLLAELEIASSLDNEHLAMEQVGALAAEQGLPPRQRERLQTAVAEATMNAMEHGNHYRADQPVRIAVWRSADALAVRIYDYGVGPRQTAEAPDLEAKLAGLQTPRGWGLHLIRHMVDEMREAEADGMHMVELIVNL